MECTSNIQFNSDLISYLYILITDRNLFTFIKSLPVHSLFILYNKSLSFRSLRASCPCPTSLSCCAIPSLPCLSPLGPLTILSVLLTVLGPVGGPLGSISRIVTSCLGGISCPCGCSSCSGCCLTIPLKYKQERHLSMGAKGLVL